MPSPNDSRNSDGDRFDPNERTNQPAGHNPAESARPPEQTKLLREQFAAFAEGGKMSPLPAQEIAATWRLFEPQLHRLFFGGDIAESQQHIQLRPLDGAVSEGGTRHIVVVAQEQESGRFHLPILTPPQALESGGGDPRCRWAGFNQHGAAVLVALPANPPHDGRLHIGLDYILSPSALQIDQDRFIARGSTTVIGSCVVNAALSRHLDTPQIASISRWRPEGTGITVFRVTEINGTRHLVLTSMENPSNPSGINAIETVPAEAQPWVLPRQNRLEGKVGIHFEDFHRSCGFEAVDVEAFTTRYPELKEAIGEYLKRVLPGHDPAWTLNLARIMQQDNSYALLISFTDKSLDTFVPAATRESVVRDSSFSGLLLTVDEEEASPPPGNQTKSLRDWFGKVLNPLRPAPPRTLHLDVVGPVLSHDAWLTHLERLSTEPTESIFFNGMMGAIGSDLQRFHEGVERLTLKSVHPVRVTADAAGTWDKVVVAVEHSYGIHLMELIRERSFGLVPSFRPNIQQYFPDKRPPRSTSRGDNDD